MKFQLTDLGKLMDAQLVAGSKPIITRIEGGDTFSAVPESLLSVQNKKQDLQVEDIAVVDGKSHLYFLLTNIEVQNEYYLRQIGIYAKPSEDADEILYIIGQDKSGERVPVISEKEVKFDYDLVITVDNSYEVTVNVNSNDFARKKMVLELDARKVDKDGGDVSNTTSQIQPSESNEKYPAFEAGKLKEMFGNCVRWLNSLKSDKVEQTEFDNHNHDGRYYTETEVDESLKKKVTASGGDISNTKVSSFAASTAAYPVPAAGESPKTLWGKVKKFCEDMNNLRASMLFIGSIVNNCATNNANLPLSAAQGKVLMDLYNVLNTKKMDAPAYGRVMEIGKYIDFHNSGSTADYDLRLSVDASNNFLINSRTVFEYVGFYKIFIGTIQSTLEQTFTFNVPSGETGQPYLISAMVGNVNILGDKTFTDIHVSNGKFFIRKSVKEHLSGQGIFAVVLYS